jgi:hypothetical protein
MPAPRSLILAAVASSLALAVSVLAGCGSSAAPTTGGPAAGDRTCRTSALKISLDMTAAGAAAGTWYVPLEFDNVSSSPCALPGFPLVSLATGPGGPDIGMPATRQDTTQAGVLTLAPGRIAHAWLAIVAAANYSPSSCGPVTARGLRVALTSAASSSFVAHDIPACARAPHGSGILMVFPVRAGRAHQGTAP